MKIFNLLKKFRRRIVLLKTAGIWKNREGLKDVLNRKNWSSRVVGTGKGIWGESDKYLKNERDLWDKK